MQKEKKTENTKALSADRKEWKAEKIQAASQRSGRSRKYSDQLNRKTDGEKRKIELLAPAGNLEKAKTAILYGADAVYIGGNRFSLRSRASNFDLPQIRELCQFAHEHNARVHVTVNMLPHPEDLDGLKQYLKDLDEAGIDAIIAASPAILTMARDLNVGYELHVSTQHSSTNSKAAEFWKKQGMHRVVLARECTLDQIRAIAEHSPLPLEVFIHGGMCISFSGRCVLSNHMTKRDANRGGCAQSCRWKYHLYDPEQESEEISDPDNLFSMSSRDLQAVDYVEDLIHAGIASLKIEGRMKSSYYIATVVSAYRQLIDEIYEKGTASKEFRDRIRTEIAKAENRPTGPGFFQGIPDETVQLYRDHDETVTQEYIARVEDVLEDGWVILQVRNRFYPDSQAEIFGPDQTSQKIRIGEIFDLDSNPLSVCSHPMMLVKTRLEGPAKKDYMIRRIEAV